MMALSGNSETSAVIKADAYGLGIKPVASALAKAGCKTFFVAMVSEGIAVREELPEVRILILNGIFPETVEDIIKHSLTPVLSSIEQLSIWAEQATTSGTSNPCAIHVDTGMNRLGLSMAEASALSEKTSLLDKLKPELLMSHPACADYLDHPKNEEQLASFAEICEKFPNLSKSIANSAGILLGEKWHYDLTRPGIAMYGGEAIMETPNPMQAVIAAEARILQVKQALAGETVGYGGCHTLTRNSRLAIASAGYADGLHRSMSGAGVPLRKNGSPGSHGKIGDFEVPILGRISMDLTAFDVTDVPQQVLQDTQWIELFGKTLVLDDAARNCGTVGYELLTSLGGRYTREYLGN